jgi:hypothetical protein
MQAMIVESIDPEGPYGAKEAGEGPLHGSLPALANALYDATGVWFTKLPFTPARVLAGCRRRGWAWRLPSASPRLTPRQRPVTGRRAGHRPPVARIALEPEVALRRRADRLDLGLLSASARAGVILVDPGNDPNIALNTAILWAANGTR